MDLKSFLFYFILPLVILFYFYFKKKFSYFKDRGIPYVEPSIPLGNFQKVGRTKNVLHIIHDVYDECKNKDVIAGIYVLTTPTYLITDLEFVKRILVKDFINFANHGFFMNEENEPLTAHLFTLEYERWRILRNKLSPVFTSGKIKSMYYAISDKGESFVSAIERTSRGNKSVDAKNVANRFTIDIISSCAFGLEANTLNNENPNLVRVLEEIFMGDGIGAFRIIFLNAFQKFSKFFNIRQYSKELSDFFIEVVAENIKYREANANDRSDFLNMLIQLKNKGSIDGECSTETQKLTLNEVLAQAFLFFFAGADTTSSAIAFAFTELANNRDIQERLREEIVEKTKETNGEITYDNLHEMHYLNQVCNESLRMYPFAFVLMRKSASDYKIPNSKHVIPKDARILIPIVGFHYDDRYWKNPYKFDPDRFTQEEIDKRPANAFMPFGEGNRICIGNRFALVNLKFGVATIVKNFKITPDAKMKYPIKINPKKLFAEPENGFLLKFEKI